MKTINELLKECNKDKVNYAEEQDILIKVKILEVLVNIRDILQEMTQEIIKK